MTSRAAAIFEARRGELNARFARAGRGLSPSLVLGYLGRTVTPLVDAWPHEHAEALALALFDLGLAGGPLGLVGEHGATPFERGLALALPRLGAPLGAAPAPVIRALGNGYLRIGRERGDAVADEWLDAIGRWGGACATREALLDLGLVLAWRLGMAASREAALERVQRLEPSIQRDLLGEGPIDPDPDRRFVWPSRGLRGETSLGPLRLVATVGGFVGFGGPFLRPPLPRVVEGRLVCTDGSVTCEIFADVFGATVAPAAWAHEAARESTAPASAGGGGAEVTPDGNVVVGELSLAIPELRGARAAARACGMVAVTLEDSHKVFVLGRTGAP